MQSAENKIRRGTLSIRVEELDNLGQDANGDGLRGQSTGQGSQNAAFRLSAFNNRVSELHRELMAFTQDVHDK